jgi:hypothetical protein
MISAEYLFAIVRHLFTMGLVFEHRDEILTLHVLENTATGTTVKVSSDNDRYLDITAPTDRRTKFSLSVGLYKPQELRNLSKADLG